MLNAMKITHQLSVAVACAVSVSCAAHHPADVDAGPMPSDVGSNATPTHRVFSFYWEHGPREMAWPWDVMTDVAIFAEGANPDGTISSSPFWTSQEVSSIVSGAHQHQRNVLVTITNYNLTLGDFDPAIVHSIVSSQAAASQFVAALQREAFTTQAADGAILDFEKIDPADRDGYVALVSQLATALHAAKPGSEVGVTLMPENARGSYDIPNLAAAADVLFDMGYPFHVPQGNPGPMSQLTTGAPWGRDCQEQSINLFAGMLTPAEKSKLLLGTMLHGTDWPATSGVPGAPATAHATGLSWSDAQAMALTHAPSWDAASLSPYISYQDTTGAWHQVWYENATSEGDRLDFIIQSGIGGIGFWTVGGEDDSLWSVVRAKLLPAAGT
jgi:spore germination protein YaaH